MGVDLGIAAFATLSDGTKVEAPKPLAKALRRLRQRQRQRQRQHSRQRRGSRNRQKSALGLARLHRRIPGQRPTTPLAKTKSVIVVEDLSVRGMMGNPHLSRSIADADWGKFRRMLEYKTKWYGSRLMTAPRFYPSTKTCSVCGYAKDGMPLSARVFRCEACGAEIDRDLNAARNLASLVSGSCPETRNACRWEGSGRENSLVKPAPMKSLSWRPVRPPPALGA